MRSAEIDELPRRTSQWPGCSANKAVSLLLAEVSQSCLLEDLTPEPEAVRAGSTGACIYMEQRIPLAYGANGTAAQWDGGSEELLSDWQG